VAYTLNGDLLSAQNSLSEVAELQLDGENILLAFLSDYHLAKIYNREGKLRRAAEFLHHALKITLNKNGEHLPIAGLAYISLAGLYYEWNELETCLKYLETGITLSKQWMMKNTLNEAYVIFARVRQAQGDTKAALKALKQASDMSGANYALPFITHEAILNLQRWIPSGILDQSILRAEKFYKNLDLNNKFSSEKLAEAPAAAHLLMAKGKLSQAEQILEPVLIEVTNSGFNLQVIEIQTVRALLYAKERNQNRAIMALTNALELAQPEGFVRMFLDEGEPMYRLLEEAYQHGIIPSYTEKLMSLFDPQDEIPSMVLNSMNQLSDREYEVLHLLSLGLTPKQIAQKLFISTGTVRNHLHNIYEKLAVKNQLQAVQCAKQLKLL